MAYGYDNLDKEGNILIYNLRESTFDVSVVQFKDGLFDVKSSEGNMKLGGKDFDERLMDLVLDHIKNEMDIDLSNNNQAKSQIKYEAERVKIELSYSEESEFFIPAMKGVLDEFGIPLSVDLKINRNKLESLITDLIDKTEELTDKSIQNANLDYDDIDTVLAVGGSSKIPIVRNMLLRKFGEEVKFYLNSEEVLAQGAAILGSIDKGIDKNNLEEDNIKLTVNNICPFTLGVEIVAKENGYLIPGKFDILINKNDIIPTFKKEVYCTVKDNQEKVLIKVFQGEDDFVKNNTHIGTVEINDIPKGVAGEQKIEVKFICKEEGILDIESTLLSTGVKVKSVFLKLNKVDLSNN